MTYTVPLSIVLFGALFWQLDHQLHVWVGGACRAPVDARRADQAMLGERPRDRWMGLATGLALSPLLLLARLPVDILWLTPVYCGWPVAAMLLLGKWRGRGSVTALLFTAAFGAEMVVLSLGDRLSSVESCIASATSVPPECQVEALTYCAEAARFWLSTWVTCSLAFATLFGGTLVVLYMIKPEDYGWPALKKERQILALLYSVVAVVMLVFALILWGLPAIRLTLRLSGLGDLN